MPEDIRETLRRAQAAEIRGERSEAVRLLKRAADLYEAAGNPGRSQQMLRHARRVGAAPERPEGFGSAPHEPAAEGSMEGGADLSPRTSESQLALAQKLAERGPTLADPAAPAWCSFCCKPKSDAGALVAGPAGAFICAACLADSWKLLQGASSPLASSAFAATMMAPPAAIDFLDAGGVMESVVQALRDGIRAVLLIGPSGSGKTACLRELARKGLASFADEGVLSAASANSRLLVDAPGQMSSSQVARLVELLRGGAKCVISVRGKPPSSRLAIRGTMAAHPLYTTEELVAASNGLPVELLEQAGKVVVLKAADARLLAEMARRMAEARHPAAAMSEDLLKAVVAEALRSKRGGHEVQALVDRLPAGSSSLAKAASKQRAGSKGRRS